MRNLHFVDDGPGSMIDSSLPGHLSDEKLAGYIDNSLVNADRAAVEAHLADCLTCRAEIVAASRAVDSAPSPTRRYRPAWAAAAAATAVAAVLVVAIVRREPALPREIAETRAEQATNSDSAVTVVTPRGGTTISARGIDFVWRRVPEILAYTITVQDADGRVMWSTSTADTAVRLPDSVAVSRGSVLHWYVDGLRADGRAMGTGRQQVTVR